MTDWEQLYQQHDIVWGAKPDFLLADMLPVMPKGRALDLGMGEGRNALYLARQGYAVKGIDVSPAAVAHCLERAQTLGVAIQAEAANMLNVEIEPESVALVVSTMALQFMKGSESAALLRKVQHWLQPGGMIYMTAFSTEEPAYARLQGLVEPIEPNTFYIERTQSYAHFFEKDELLGLFSGFKVHYVGQVLKLDGGHPGALSPHYHGIITYIGEKLS